MRWSRLFFGLKWKRLHQWVKVVHMAEDRPNWLGLIREALNGTSKKNVWRSRMRGCIRCPIYDATTRRCRPYEGSTLGCACYCPLIALFYRHPCWGRIHLPDEPGVGWE